MTYRACKLALLLILLAFGPACLSAQVLIDRIVARVENDVILLSEVRALSRYQDLVEGKTESESQILDRLIDQWIVRSEADTAQFAHPSDEDVSHGVERVEKSFPSTEEYESRKKQVGLTDQDIRELIAAQLYLSNYLDSRFRPSAQVSSKDITDFYERAVVPRAQARGEAPPPLDIARDYIREALVQRSIDEQTERWLNESRGRVKVEKFLEEASR